MQCPFPGMDPYIERPALWPDFHDSMITEIRGALQPLLRPKYAALVQDRLYVVESERSIYPDVAVVEAAKKRSDGSRTVTEIEEPLVFEVWEEELREPYVEIVETAGANRLVTTIEVLSPDNKQPGAGRKKYLQKRREVRRARANVVEIDLLRFGKPTLRLSTTEEIAWCEQQLRTAGFHRTATS